MQWSCTCIVLSVPDWIPLQFRSIVCLCAVSLLTHESYVNSQHNDELFCVKAQHNEELLALMLENVLRTRDKVKGDGACVPLTAEHLLEKPEAHKQHTKTVRLCHPDIRFTLYSSVRNNENRFNF